MPSSMKDQRPISSASANKKWVAIHGRFSLTTTLLKNALLTAGGFETPIFVDVLELLAKNDISDALILIDSHAFTQPEIDTILSQFEQCQDSPVVAISNISPGFDIEPYLKWSVLKGAFAKDLSPYLILRGVHSILDGGTWFPREVLERFVVNHRTEVMGEECINAEEELQLRALTHREIEIVCLIATGACNNSIADSLCLSPHTVKTHIYNIFKKLDVDNRIQAANWAKCFLKEDIARFQMTSNK